jgi:mannose-6-phosphate isomerase-like protein (cupin superfamily)
MKPLVPVTLVVGVVVGYLAGSLGSPATVVVQAQQASATQTDLRSVLLGQPTEGQYWDGANMAKMHADRLASGVARGPHPLSSSMRSRTHSISVLTRLFHDKPIKAALTGRMSEFDNGEIHDGVTDIYFIVAGSGRVSVGGELQNKVARPISEGSPIHHPGEYIGQPVTGGKVFQVKPGDVVNIPPGLAHWARPDKNGLTYYLLKVNVGMYPWTSIASLSSSGTPDIAH